MAIKKTSVTLDGLKHNLDDRDRVGAQALLETTDGISFSSTDTQIPLVNPVSGSASAITITKATHSGRTTVIPQSVGALVTHLMPLPEKGVKYHFVYVGGAVANEDIEFSADASGAHFEGAISFLDTGGSALATVYCDGTDDDVIDLKVPNGFDITFVGKDSTNYYVYGSMQGATTLTCS